MRVLYVCKSLDDSNPYTATQIAWIRSLASKPQIEHVRVLAPANGRSMLPTNVTVHVLGRSGWWRRIIRFYRELARRGCTDVDFFFVAQGGPYPALLLPVKLIRRRPLYQWKAHSHVSPRMRFYARLCDDLIFTATPSSLPIDLDKVRIVGHGIDTGQFRPREGSPRHDLVAPGRIAPAKRLEWAVRALGECRDRFGVTPTLDIVGTCSRKDEPYRQQLVALIAGLGLTEAVTFRGAVQHGDVPDLLGHYRAMLNFSETAFDKAAAEAMAVGVPVITTNPCTIETLSQDLQRQLAAPEGDVAEQASLIHDVLSWDDNRRAAVGKELRGIVVRDHSIDSFFDRILAHIEAHLEGPDQSNAISVKSSSPNGRDRPAKA